MQIKKTVKKLLKEIGVGKLYWKFVGFSAAWIEPVLFAIPAFFFYVGLVLAKVVWRRKYVFCWISGFRIGHMAANTEVFLRRVENTNYYDRNCIYVGFCYHFPICNRQLLNMYRKVIPVIESRIFEKLMNTWIKKTEFSFRPLFYSNEYYELNNLRPVLSFTQAEEKRGKQLLAEMGIKETDWFICFHSRDRKYLGDGYEYHDHRDCDIENYLKAAEYIAELGGYAIRMGMVVEKTLPKDRHPHIIDYAVDYRSDFMDIYLTAKCKFFLGNTAGLLCVPTIFGVPVAAANYIPLQYTPIRKGDLYIPKKIWDNKMNKILSFSEIVNSGAWRYQYSKQYEESGMKVIENTADEILALAQEMYMLLEGKLYRTAEDEGLQDKFRFLFKQDHLRFNSPARIGAHFLRQNKELLS